MEMENPKDLNRQNAIELNQNNVKQELFYRKIKELKNMTKGKITSFFKIGKSEDPNYAQIEFMA
jgi:hypothetical protein